MTDDASKLGDACRTGCPTRDHASWGECVRAARIGVDRESLRVNDARGR